MKDLTRRDFFKMAGGFSILTLAGCNKDNSDLSLIEEQITSLGFKSGKDSYFDDVLVCHPGIEVRTVRSIGPFNMSLVDASNMMEKSIAINELFEKHGFKNDDPISSNDDLLNDYYFSDDADDNITIEENELINLSYDEVKSLLDDLDEDSLNEIEKNECRKKLYFIRKYYSSWNSLNNSKICSELLLMLLKSYVCQIVGLKPEQFDNVTIDSRGNIVVEFEGFKYEYKIDKSSGILNECLESLYECQSFPTSDKIDAYNKAVNNAIITLKNGMLCGVKEENGVLKPEVELTDEKIEEVVNKVL